MTRVLERSSVDVVLDGRAEVAESPVWDADRRVLVWVDIPRGLVHRLDPATGRDVSVALGQPVGAVALRAGGGLVLATRDGFALLDAAEDEVRSEIPVERDRPANRMNDGKCDAAGRFWAGTMALDESAGAGTLYRMGTDRRVDVVLANVTMSNGLDWSPDARTFYFVDTSTGGVDAFDHDAATGALTNRRRLVDVDPGDGLPDGLTVDAEGFLWLALWGGAVVRRYSPVAELDTVVELPVSQVTSCAFGGPDLDELYVTSAAEGLGSGEARRREPHAGAILRIRPGVPGRLPGVFAG